MKKLGSQFAVAVVCCILGFMLAYQFKLMNKQNKNFSSNNDGTQITAEIDSLNKQKSNLQGKVNDLQEKLKKYETSAANENEIDKQIYNELNYTRMLTGNVDIKGQGIILTIVPQSGLTGSVQSQPINDKDLVYIINYLNSADAEGISLNDIRITSRTGIRNAGSSIIVNDDEKISPFSKVIIKAVGNKKNLDAALNFPGAIPKFPNCDIKIEQSDNIVINKYDKTYKFNYAKPVGKN